jgi:hypothetical protein
MRRPDPQYSAASVGDVNYIRLGYKIRLSRLYTLDPPFSISFSMEQPFGNTGPQAKK